MVDSGQPIKNKVRLDIYDLKSGRLVLEKKICEGATLKDLLNEVGTTHREIIELIFDFHSQKLTGAMAVILNGTFIQFANELETKINGGDILVFIPLLVGG